MTLSRILTLLALLFSAVGAPVAAQTFPPRPDGPVYDGANIIGPAEEHELDQRLRDWTERTGRPIVVASVPTLGNSTIEQYAAELYKQWGIGLADTDEGVLLLIAQEERKVRIEVGYGLTPYITDILSGQIIRNTITPRFKKGDFAGGINAGVDALTQQLSLAPENAAAVAQAAERAEAQRQEESGFPIGAIFWIGFLLFFFVLPALGGGRRRRYRKRGGMGGLAGDIILWEAGKAIARGLSDHDDWGGGGGFGAGGFGGGGGGFGGFGGGMSGGGGASGGW